MKIQLHNNGLVQDCSISNADALKILQSCTKLSISIFLQNSKSRLYIPKKTSPLWPSLESYGKSLVSILKTSLCYNKHYNIHLLSQDFSLSAVISNCNGDWEPGFRLLNRISPRPPWPCKTKASIMVKLFLKKKGKKINISKKIYTNLGVMKTCALHWSIIW